MADPVEISILNQKFLLKRGRESKEYIEELAGYVNEKMRELQEKTKSVATANVAILAALNIADECLKTGRELKKLRGLVSDEVKGAVSMIDMELKALGGIPH